MFLADTILAILRIMETFLIAVCILIIIPYCVTKVRYEILAFHLRKRQLKQNEEDVERFIEELYEWAKINSNLISAR